MRVVQFKRSRVIKFLLIGITVLAGLILVLKNFQTELNLGSDFLAQKQIVVGNPGSQARHVSHPEEIPVFKGSGNKGNFEPEAYGGGSEPGDDGKAVKIRFEEKADEDKLKNVYGFNQLVSDKISLNRTVPDTREEECKYWDYPTNLPTASIILVFHNEGWSTLLRTVNSVINRSPPEFLHEIILVDDKSELDHLHGQLEEEMKKPYYRKVLIVRNKEREGLIRARNNGAVAATGRRLRKYSFKGLYLIGLIIFKFWKLCLQIFGIVCF